MSKLSLKDKIKKVLNTGVFFLKKYLGSKNGDGGKCQLNDVLVMITFSRRNHF